MQHLGHGAVGELELPLVVELEEDGAVRVAALDVQEVLGGVLRGAAAVLAHVQLGSPLLVAEGQALAVHLPLVRLQAAALGEGLAAVALEGLDAWGQHRNHSGGDSVAIDISFWPHLHTLPSPNKSYGFCGR